MKKITLSLAISSIMLAGISAKAQVPVRPVHVILVLEENYAYSEIIGSSYAPTFTALSKASTTVNFTQMFAITHPSEPNYLDLFSGSDQGVIADETGPDAGASFNDCNMASSVIAKGFTFKGYSETQPSVGWFSGNSGNYCTKHCPWINWMEGDNGSTCKSDSVPAKDDVPFAPVGTYFPDSNHYSTLPTVSWIIPNLVDDMHDPSTPSTAISNGDKWFKTNVMPLVRWCQQPASNSLVIVVWDEDDGSAGNNIPMLFCSSLCNGGTCSTKLNHYDLLKTVEDMYGATLCGSASSGVDVPTSIWNLTSVNTVNQPVNDVTAWPVPAKNQLNMNVSSVAEGKANIGMYDITGRLVKEMPAELKVGDNYLTINTDDVSSGIYFLNIKGDNINISKKVVVSK
jgi:hypothetical protein